MLCVEDLLHKQNFVPHSHIINRHKDIALLSAKINIEEDIKDLGFRQAVNTTRDGKNWIHYVTTSSSTSG